MKKKIFLGIKVPGGSKSIPALQNIFSTYGNVIQTRLGLHEINEDTNEPYGLVLLGLSGDPMQIANMEKEVLCLDDVEIKKCIFRSKKGFA